MGIEHYVFALFIAALVCIIAIICKILFSNVKRQSKMLDEREKQILQTYNAVETIMEEFQDQAKATIDELNLREQEYRAAMRNMAAFQLPPELDKKEQTAAIERVPREGTPDANKIKAASEVIERASKLAGHDPIPPPVKAAQNFVYSSGPATAPAPAYAPGAVNSPGSVYAPNPAYTSQPSAGSPGATHAPAAVPAAGPAAHAIGTAMPDAAAKQPLFQKFFDDAAQAPPPTPYTPAAINGGSRRDAILALAGEGKSDVEIASSLGITRNEVQLVIGLTK